MTTADDIIKRLDAWGAEPGPNGGKRDAVLAGILKDANALVEAKAMRPRCSCGGITGSDPKWCEPCMNSMRLMSTYGQMSGCGDAMASVLRLGNSAAVKKKPAPESGTIIDWSIAVLAVGYVIGIFMIALALV